MVGDWQKKLHNYGFQFVVCELFEDKNVSGTIVKLYKYSSGDALSGTDIARSDGSGSRDG